VMGCPPCELPDLDYSTVDRGRIVCTACGWGWLLDLDGDHGRPGWQRANPERMGVRV
jgi:transcription initiation factor TFIIIB Brf1 subunit/transcription initiation factor TFIIB